MLADPMYSIQSTLDVLDVRPYHDPATTERIPLENQKTGVCREKRADLTSLW